MNAAKLQAKKLLNYRFKNDLGHVKTANVIEVYKNITKSHHSAIETLTIWTTVLSDFIPQCLKKYVKETQRTKFERFDRLKILKQYRNAYDTFITHLGWSIDRGLGVYNESNFDTIKFIIDDYTQFLRSLNNIVGDMEQKIEYREIHQNLNPKAFSWYESKEIIPGHYSDITKFNHLNRQYYYYHPGTFDLNV